MNLRKIGWKIGDYCSRKVNNKPLNRFRINLIKDECGVKSIMQLPKREIPQRLIYKHSDNENYSMFDTKNGNFLGRMRAYTELNDFYYEEFTLTKSFFIARLNAFVKNQKVGTDFINFAQKESFKQKCHGLVSLSSGNIKRPPHVFYRKLGFDSRNREKISFVDEAIQNGTDLPREAKNWVIDMFFPIDKIKKP